MSNKVILNFFYFNKDYVLVRNGPESNAERLALLTGGAKSNPVYLQSTNEAMYLYIHTDLSDSRKGFRFRYSMGCDLSLETTNGTLVSPGFGMENYPHNLECDYRLRGPGGRPVSLRFLQFGLDDSDSVEIYDGSSTNGVPLHPSGGFKGTCLWFKLIPDQL